MEAQAAAAAVVGRAGDAARLKRQVQQGGHRVLSVPLKVSEALGRPSVQIAVSRVDHALEPPPRVRVARDGSHQRHKQRVRLHASAPRGRPRWKRKRGRPAARCNDLSRALERCGDELSPEGDAHAPRARVVAGGVPDTRQLEIQRPHRERGLAGVPWQQRTAQVALDIPSTNLVHESGSLRMCVAVAGMSQRANSRDARRVSAQARDLQAGRASKTMHDEIVEPKSVQPVLLV